MQSSNKKRTLEGADIEDNAQSANIETESRNKNKKLSAKKLKIKYELEKEAEKLISNDSINKKYWDDCIEMLGNGKKVRALCLNIHLSIRSIIFYNYIFVILTGIFG